MSSRFTSREIWRHNGFLGQVARARKAMLQIFDAPTTTTRSCELAAEIEEKLAELEASLKERAE